MIVRAGIPYSLEYATFDQESGLYIGAEIRDITSGRPGVLIDTIQLLDDGDGLYYALFTPSANKRYRIKKRQYQDLGLTTIDPSRAPDVEFLDVVSLLEQSDVEELMASNLETLIIEIETDPILEVTIEDDDVLEIEVKEI